MTSLPFRVGEGLAHQAVQHPVMSTCVDHTRGFGRYSKQHPLVELRTKRLQQDPKLAAIVGAWHEFCRNFIPYTVDGSEESEDDRIRRSDTLYKMFRTFDYSPSDVSLFTLCLSEFGAEPQFGLKAGLFLSALINRCPQSTASFEIFTHTIRPLDDFGFHNKRDVLVHGDLGKRAGANSLGGRLVINGNVGHGLSYYSWCGLIELHGDAGYNTCEGARTGTEIRLFGNYKSMVTASGNPDYEPRVFHNGKLILPKQV